MTLPLASVGHQIFIGQFSDDTGLSYLNARYYDPARGQFISQDPVFWSQEQNLKDPQSLNSYSYAQNNPITGKDPDGKEVVTSFAIGEQQTRCCRD